MKIRHRTLRVVAASILILGTVTLAASPVGTRNRGSRGPRGRGTDAGPKLQGLFSAITHRLDLTDEQAEKIRDMAEETRQDADIAREALAEARKTLRDAVAGGAAEEQIRGSAEALGKALSNQAILRGKLLASVKEVLTDEQRERFERLQERVGPLRGRSRWSDDRLGWGRQSHGARFRPEMQHSQGHQRNRWQRGTGWEPADDRGRRSRRPSRASWSEQRPRGRFQERRVQQRGRGSVPLKRMFEKADTNGDEVLDRKEIDAFRGKATRGPQARPW